MSYALSSHVGLFVQKDLELWMMIKKVYLMDRNQLQTNAQTYIYVILQLWQLYQAYTSGLEKNSSSHRKHTIILNLVYLFNSISYSFFLKMR